VRQLIFVGLAGLGVGLVSCSKSPDPAHVAPAAGASQAPSQPLRATAPRPENPRDIGALFQVEASNRPAGALRVEDVLAAFRRSGIELSEERQHLGRPYGARYCVGAKSSPELALSVCEYVDAAAARDGTAISNKIPLKDRDIRVQRATSLTVRLITKTPASQAVAVRLFDAFSKL
jgi:hypothetical protein